MHTLRGLLAAPLDPDRCEGTAYPWWMIVDPKGIAGHLMTKDDAITRVGMSGVTGPFFSREAATRFLNHTRYNFGKDAVVWCASGCYSKDYKALLELAKAPECQHLNWTRVMPNEIATCLDCNADFWPDFQTPAEPVPVLSQAELDRAIEANRMRPCECVGGCAESIPQGYSRPHGLPPGVYCRISGPKAAELRHGLERAGMEPEVTETIVRDEPEPMTPRDKQTFIAYFKGIQALVHENARSKGWHKEDHNDGELIALMHSELSEALEALRHGNPPSDHIPEFTGVEEEMADVVIRIMDYAAAKGHRVAEAVIAKMAFNATRPYKHGGKRF